MITNNIHLAKEVLENEGIIGLPTETVYGLAGNIYNDHALEKIFSLKKRPFYNPLIVHIKNTEEVFKIATEIPEKAIELANKFWPGPLTLILKKQVHISSIITANKPTVAVRVPNHPIALELLSKLDYPLAAPSANPFGLISPTTAQHVDDYFGEELTVILEGGPCQSGIESTIVGFIDDEPIIYRLGALSLEEIEEAVGRVYLNTHSENSPEAPGMLTKHYSPKIPLILSNNIHEIIEQNTDKRIGILSNFQQYNHTSIITQEVLSLKGNLSEAASNLYSALHRLDKQNIDLIIAEIFPENNLGKSINDRLNRASKQ